VDLMGYLRNRCMYWDFGDQDSLFTSSYHHTLNFSGHVALFNV
jgi:hypothetical protein